MNQKKILVVDDDREIGELIDITLKNDGHLVLRANDGFKGLELAKSQTPDLIIMDVDMPGMDGFTLCKRLRKDKTLHLIPIIILTGSRTQPNDLIEGLQTGADDYILKPFMPQELSIRVTRLLKRTDEHLSVNPLTKLPGTYTLENEITKRIEFRIHFAACYFDLDHFKAFNDHYGYKWGDEIIKYIAGLISKSVVTLGNEDDLLVHVGGDDFIVITTPDKVESICEKVISDFSKDTHKYYKDVDKERGYITTFNRKGVQEDFPLLTLSIGAVSTENREITHYAQMVDILNELKKHAKLQPGSVLVKDKRFD
ncbi:MAG: response regulator [Endomicrobiales bacterium]|nr:response regulator [Endomicrobiales bacterium]